ncbi:bifunctional nicotinamidase/pyrazinamidase [Lichenicoccus sp.]|uniref:bifunctional nicotinamidase/pyrazinamidase n=1 Tax=Lichenicoccus sp. TaxID=2781899 RepID=UPI003D114496
MHIDPRTDILAVIDVQPTFMPGGELAVPDGDTVLPLVNHLLQDRFALGFATQDWHPAGHSSFASSHPDAAPYDTIRMPYGPQILWPDHAIAGTPNAALHPDLAQDRLRMILRKGTDPAIDSYSAFRENDHTRSTGLAGWLRERGLKRLFLCGLAQDFCVAWSARDAVQYGFEAVVIEDACRAINAAGPDGRFSLDVAREDLLARGVTLLPAAALA